MLGTIETSRQIIFEHRGNLSSTHTTTDEYEIEGLFVESWPCESNWLEALPVAAGGGGSLKFFPHPGDYIPLLPGVYKLKSTVKYPLFGGWTNKVFTQPSDISGHTSALNIRRDQIKRVFYKIPMSLAAPQTIDSPILYFHHSGYVYGHGYVDPALGPHTVDFYLFLKLMGTQILQILTFQINSAVNPVGYYNISTIPVIEGQEYYCRITKTTAPLAIVDMQIGIRTPR